MMSDQSADSVRNITLAHTPENIFAAVENARAICAARIVCVFWIAGSANAHETFFGNQARKMRLLGPLILVRWTTVFIVTPTDNEIQLI